MGLVILTKLLKRIVSPWESYWFWSLRMGMDVTCICYGCFFLNFDENLHFLLPTVGCMTFCVAGLALSMILSRIKTHDTYYTTNVFLWDIVKLVMTITDISLVAFFRNKIEPTNEKELRRSMHFLIYGCVVTVIASANLILLICVVIASHPKSKASNRRVSTGSIQETEV